MKFCVVIVIGVLINSLSLASSNASGNASGNAYARPSYDAIDAVSDQIPLLYKSSKARAVKKAYDALQSKKYVLARTLAKPIQDDRKFSDYGFWVAAASFRAEASANYRARKFSSSLELAGQSIESSLKVSERTPHSPFVKLLAREIAEAELIIGDANWAMKKWAAARDAYEKAFQRLAMSYALDQVRPGNLDRYFSSCSRIKRLGASDSFCEAWMRRFAAFYPKRSVEFATIEKHFPSAEKNNGSVSKLTQTYKGPDLDQIAFDQVMSLYFEEKYSKAVDGFRKFLDEFPRSVQRFRARYWLAQSLSHEQKHEDARKLYEDIQKDSPLGYYGLLAAVATGKFLGSYIDATLPLAADNDPNLHPHEMIRLARAQNFIAEGAPALAAFELRDLRARDALSSQFLMYLTTLNYEARNYNTAFSILTDLIQRGYTGVASSHGLRLIFPLAYIGAVRKHAQEQKLDPILVLSLIKQESAFDPAAVSVSGAAGLMQLMPATAADTMPDVARSDLSDADTNIGIGTKYLKQMLNKFNGNIVHALASYNAGPTAVDRWLRAIPEKRGMLEFIESIPYRETREYVSTIVRNYFWYSYKINGETAKSLSYFWNIYGPPEKPVELKQVRATDR